MSSKMELTAVELEALKKLREKKLDGNRCFCGLEVTEIESKNGDKTWVKCGRSKSEMKEGQRPCTLFCEKQDLPIMQEILSRAGITDYEEHWPECDHMLKTKVSINTKDDNKCYFTCRLGMYDPDIPCDFFRGVNFGQNQKRKAKKRKISRF